MPLSVGVDLIEIERIRRALERHGDGFKERCFTEAERAYCDSKPNPPQHYAGRFAAKEAVGKALGSGGLLHVEGDRDPRPPQARRPPDRAHRRLGGEGRCGTIELSMTHSRELAAAVAVVVDR